MGTSVHGFGGRKHMKTGRNSRVTPSPEIENVVDRLVYVVRNPSAAEQCR